MLTEKHLNTNENIHVSGFKWIGQNGLKYKRLSSGLEFLINYDVYTVFYVDVVDVIHSEGIHRKKIH